MSRIFWDTNLFIYLFEQHPQFAAPTIRLWRRIHERGDTLVTSWLTIAEIQVKPKMTGDLKVCKEYKRAILQTAEVVPFADGASDAYLEIRSNTKVKGPDAIQLACAASANVALFVTNDQRLASLTIPGIHFITSLDRAPI